MSRVRCLYCDVENDAVQSAGYCESCGKKLPPASLAHRRHEPVLHQGAGARPSEIERTAAESASAWLFTAAIVNLIGCGALVVLAPLLVPREHLKTEFIPELLLVSVAVLLIFGALGWWARGRPVPALIAAVIVYLGLSIVDALLAPGLVLLGLPVKIAIVVLLIQAFRVSRKPRRLIV
ncbi:MAG TPA: hypothetical protein VMG10_00045 [Gemmataceae bacterium]|nr:hypothetical protein [Gemmataceae bacterium]